MPKNYQLNGKLTQPDEKEIKGSEVFEWFIKYKLYTTKYCKRCDKEVNVELLSLKDYPYWFVAHCSQCDGITKTVFKRQTMPFCEKCGESFKMNNNDALWEVYDQTGDRICPNCITEYINELKNVKQNICTKNE